MATIFVVFRAFGEGDGWTVYDMEGAFSTLELARAYILTKYDNNYWSIKDACIMAVHSDMHENNHWIYVGKRDNCKSDCPYGCEGGWIIEEMALDGK